MNISDYTRYALKRIGFTQPTDEAVNHIVKTAETATEVNICGSSYVAVDALIAALRACYPTRASLEFIDSMQKLESQAGLATSKLDELKERLDQLFDTDLPPGVPGAPVLPGQVYPPPAPAPGQPAGTQQPANGGKP